MVSPVLVKVPVAPVVEYHRPSVVAPVGDAKMSSVTTMDEYPAVDTEKMLPLGAIVYRVGNSP